MTETRLELNALLKRLEEHVPGHFIYNLLSLLSHQTLLTVCQYQTLRMRLNYCPVLVTQTLHLNVCETTQLSALFSLQRKIHTEIIKKNNYSLLYIKM